MGQREKALALMEEAKALDITREKKDYESLLLKAEETDPNIKEIFLLLGLFYYRGESWKGAVEYLSRYIKMDYTLLQDEKRSQNIYLCLLKSYQQAGNREESSRYIRNFVGTFPCSAVSLNLVERVFRKFDRKDEWYKNLCEGFRRLSSGHYAEALKLFDKAIELHPKFSWGYYLRGLSFMGCAQFQKAADDFLAASNLDDEFLFFYQLACAYKADGKSREAEVTTIEALSRNPFYVPAYILLGETYMVNGNADMAGIYLKKAMEIDPEGPLVSRIKELLESPRKQMPPHPQKEEKVTHDKVQEILALAQEEAEKIVQRAKEEESTILSRTQEEAHRILEKARDEALKEKEALTGEMNKLKKDLLEKTKEIVDKAQLQARSIIDAAKREESTIMRDAHSNASSIIRKADEKAQIIMEKAKRMTSSIADGKREEEQRKIKEEKEHILQKARDEAQALVTKAQEDAEAILREARAKEHVAEVPEAEELIDFIDELIESCEQEESKPAEVKGKPISAKPAEPEINLDDLIEDYDAIQEKEKRPETGEEAPDIAIIDDDIEPSLDDIMKAVSVDINDELFFNGTSPSAAEGSKKTPAGSGSHVQGKIGTEPAQKAGPEIGKKPPPVKPPPPRPVEGAKSAPISDKGGAQKKRELSEIDIVINKDFPGFFNLLKERGEKKPKKKPSRPDRDVQELLMKAKKLCDSNDWYQAGKLFLEVLQKDNDNEEACAGLSEVYVLNGMLNEAVIQNCELVRILYDNGKVERALKIAEKTQNIDSEGIMSRMNKILFYKKEDKHENMKGALLELAQVCAAKGLQNRAVETIELLGKLFPEDLDFALKCADAHFSSGNKDKALAQYRSVADRLLKQGNKVRALQVYKKVKELSPPDKSLHMLIGKLHQEAGELDAAETEFRAALKNNVNDIEGLCALGTICMQKKSFRDALLAFSKVLQINPSAVFAKEQLGLLHHSMGNKEVAVKNLMEAARHYMNGGNTEKAASISKKVLQIDPNNRDALAALKSMKML